TISAFAIMGVGIGAYLRLKDKDQKGQAAEFAITAILAGTSEPTLYGICMRYKRPFIGLLGGGFLGGLYCGITGVISATLVPATNFTSILCFTGADLANIVNGAIGCGIALVATVLLVYFFGFDKDEPAIQKQA
ncbi:MAG: PTS fructose transporter subunit IIB, partial [Olsenella sp.]